MIDCMKYVYYIITLVFVAAIMSSCTNDEYKNVIPADSDAIVMINVKSIAEKADLAESKMLQLAKENVSIVVNPKDKDKADALIDDPASTGIDFREPACLFHRPDGCYGLVLKLADKDDFEEFLQMLRANNVVSKAVERDDVMCCKLLGEICLLYDKRAALLYANSMLQSGERDMKSALALMKQDKDKSYSTTYTFDTHIEGKDIVVLTNNARRSIEELMPKGKQWPFFCLLGDMSSVVTANFDNGKVAIEAELLPKTDDGRRMMEDMKKNLYKINGKFSKYDTRFVSAWACFGANGKWMLNLLKKSPQCKEYLFLLERCIDVEQMISSIDGDVLVSLNPQKEFFFTVAAELNNSDFLKDVDYWKQSMAEYGASMDNVSATDYCLRLGGTQKKFFWGVKDGDLYFTSISRPVFDTGNILSSLIRDDISDYLFYAYINDDSCLKGNNRSLFLMNSNCELESVIAKSKTFGKMTVDINLKDKKVNFLKGILE